MNAKKDERPLLYQSELMSALVSEADRVAQTGFSVMLVGETGVGKENFARHIHEKSKRADSPFVAISGPAISVSLAASELFGHEKGSFTGAHQRRHGAFELAKGGTLFIDEITEMSLDIQAMLLRVLQEKALCRVGGSDLISVNVRLITATNRDPQQAINDGKLREDLYYRLQGFEFAVPPLRERREDIPLLTQYVVGELAKEYDGPLPSFSLDAARLMVAYNWPGNIRELQNVIRHVAIKAGDGANGQVLHEHLPPKIASVGLLTESSLAKTFDRIACELVGQKEEEAADMFAEPESGPAETDQGVTETAPEPVGPVEKTIVEMAGEGEVPPQRPGHPGLPAQDSLEKLNKIIETYFPFMTKHQIATEAGATARACLSKDAFVPAASSIATILSSRGKGLSGNVSLVLRTHLKYKLLADEATLAAFDEDVRDLNLLVAQKGAVSSSVNSPAPGA